MASSDQLALVGTLKGHNGWVTQIATCAETPDRIVSSSRGAFTLSERESGVSE
jgi:hypothetical protein